MIKHIWTVLAQKAIIESQSNSLSLIDVMEELTVTISKKAPKDLKIATINIPISYEVVSYLLKDSKNNEDNPLIRIQILNPKGKIMKSFEHLVAWEKGKERMRTRAHIMGLNVDLPGNYIFRIYLKEKIEDEYSQVAEIPLKVKIQELSPVAAKK